MILVKRDTFPLRSSNHAQTEERGHWYWVCSCGQQDNTNTDPNCKTCGVRITCRVGGGTAFAAGAKTCENGCCLRNPKEEK